MSDVILRYGQNPAFTRRRRWMRPERLDAVAARSGVLREALQALSSMSHETYRQFASNITATNLCS